MDNSEAEKLKAHQRWLETHYALGRVELARGYYQKDYAKRREEFNALYEGRITEEELLNQTRL